MLSFKVLLSITILCLTVVSGELWVNYTIDAVKYFQMPILNKLDDYDACMEVHKEKARYCIVRTAIKPDLSSENYNFIVEFSSRKKQHYRHDKLIRGVCLNTCQKLLNELDALQSGESDSFYEPPFHLDYNINFDFVGFANATEDREKFNRIVNQCINVELVELYNLRGYSSIEYCTQTEDITKIDWLDILFVVLCSILITIICISSICDERNRVRQWETAKIQANAVDFYKTSPTTFAQKLAVAFSFQRNWYVLSAPVRPEMRDLRSISGMRIWTMISIVYGHCTWFMTAVPIVNPLFVEKSYHQMFPMLAINGGNLVQSFFFIGGFLNSMVLLAYVEKNKIKDYTIVIKTFVYRVVRFAPVLLFLVLLHATWLYRQDTGPYWDLFNFRERQACRENLWTNMLFINNYVSGDMKCVVHTWFLAADLHLSVLATAILLVAINYPKRRNLILFGSIFVSFVISFVHMYINKLEPILILSPETLRNQLIETSPYDRYFYEYHSPTHLNTGNYLIGLTVGYFYYEFKKSGAKHRRTLINQILFHGAYMMTFVLSFIGIYFYETDIEKGVWSALIGAILKHIYGPIFGFILVGMVLRYGQVIPRVFNYGYYRVLARLSFSVYMIHVSVAAAYITGHQHQLEINNLMLNSFAGIVYLISHTYAYLLATCIEIPSTVIYKAVMEEFFEKQPPAPVKQNGTNNNAYDIDEIPKLDITKM